MDLGINTASVTALREFSKSMPYAVTNIREANDKLKGVYEAVQKAIGPHENEFRGMLDILEKVQENATIAVENLSPKLQATADDMEAFIAQHPELSD